MDKYIIIMKRELLYTIHSLLEKLPFVKTNENDVTFIKDNRERLKKLSEKLKKVDEED